MKSKQTPALVTENHITLFYLIPKSPDDGGIESISLSDLAGETGKSQPNRWINNRARESIGKFGDQQPVWQRTSLSLSEDLLSFIHKLTDPITAQDAARITTYKLSTATAKIVRGSAIRHSQGTPKSQRLPYQLSLSLTPSAISRIKEESSDNTNKNLIAKIDDVYCYQFLTEITVISLTLSLENPTGAYPHPYAIVEGVSSLARFNRLCWKNHDSQESMSEEFSLASLVRGLVADTRPAQGSRRVYTASFLRLNGILSQTEKQKLLVQLSRHHGSEYQHSEAADEFQHLAEFETPQHMVSLEGVATVVSDRSDGKEPPEFLQNYYSKAFKPVYLPLLLLAFHQRQALLHYTNLTTFWLEAKQKENHKIGILEEIRDLVFNFRLNFQPTVISRIAQHNRYHQALRQQLELDVISEKLNTDSSEISGWLQERHSARSERKMRWINSLATFGVAALTAYTIAEETLHAFHLGGEKAGMIAVIFGAIIGIPAGYLHFRESNSKRPHWIKHAIDEVAVKHNALD